STDTPWLEVPYRELGLPSGETCRRRMEEWSRSGAFQRALVVLQKKLRDAEKLDWSRVIVDASLVDAKKGARRSRARSAAARAAHVAKGSRSPPARRRARSGAAKTTALHTRPASTRTLADRTHQRLAESTPPHRNPPRPQARELPSLPPPRHDCHPPPRTFE